MRVTSTPKPFEIDCKRFYMPGTTISDICPKCGHEQENDLGDQYLGHPTANGVDKYGFYCHKCEHEWSKKVILRVVLEEAK